MSDRLTIDIFGVLHGGAEGLLAIGARADRVTTRSSGSRLPVELRCFRAQNKLAKPSQL